MVLADRHIHHLRLRGPSTTVINRGATLLEDALRTASMPTVPGRVLLVKSLPLGAVDLHSNSLPLALLIEQRMREVVNNAVHIAAPLAPQANAVYYHDEVEGLLLLAQRVAGAQSANDWFWPRILPGWEPKARNLPRLFNAVIQNLPSKKTHQGAVVVNWLALLHNNNLLHPILQSLSPADGARLLHIFEWSVPTTPDSQPTSTIPAHLVLKLARWEPILRDWIRHWGPTDARSHWLTRIALEHTLPALPPAFISVRAEAVIEWANQSPLSGTKDATSGALAQATLADSNTAMHTVSQPPEPEITTPEEGASDKPVPGADPGFSIQPGTAYTTTLAGLFYCIKILDYLGIGVTLANNPEWAEQQLVGHIFRAIALRLELPLTDPALAVLTADLGARPFPVQAFSVPDRWAEMTAENSQVMTNGTWSARLDAAGLPLAVWSGTMPAAVYDATFHPPTVPMAWAIAVERWCSQYLEMPLDSLINRPAQIMATRTHLDIIFTHEQVDIAVRRAGLDFDPGWIPWLGKVVKFYYENGL